MKTNTPFNNQEKTWEIREKHRKHWETGKRRKHGKTGRIKKKHRETWETRGKRTKTRETRDNVGKTGECIET